MYTRAVPSQQHPRWWFLMPRWVQAVLLVGMPDHGLDTREQSGPFVQMKHAPIGARTTCGAAAGVTGALQGGGEGSNLFVAATSLLVSNNTKR